MQQSAEVICDSIGPNGKRITTFLINHWRGIHAELLRHRLFSFSVASSRAIPYKVQRRQVEEDPMMPILFPSRHKGMQGIGIFDGWREKVCNILWLKGRDAALLSAKGLDKIGVSKQLTNRILEPWVNTRAVVTATEWDNYFDLRHPWHKEETFQDMYITGNPESRKTSMGTRTVWEDEVKLNFPAEYNIQDLAIKMKKALDGSEPVDFSNVNGGWHLPFIEEHEKPRFGDAKHWSEEKWKEHDEKMIKISAARCARTSYGKNVGKSIEDEIKLADFLLKDKHLSPFEHQAQALPEEYKNPGSINTNQAIPKGCELRITQNDQGRNVEIWSRNLKGWTQARATLD